MAHEGTLLVMRHAQAGGQLAGLRGSWADAAPGAGALVKFWQPPGG